MTQLQEQKRKIILLFKEYKIYPQFRAVVNLMAAVADYTWRLDDVPEFFRSLESSFLWKNTRRGYYFWYCISQEWDEYTRYKQFRYNY